jgi:hypothetical protein
MLAPLTAAVMTRQPQPHPAPTRLSGPNTAHQPPLQAASQRGKKQHHHRGLHQHDGDDPGRPFGCWRDIEGPEHVVGVQTRSDGWVSVCLQAPLEVWVGQVTDQPPRRDRHRHDQRHGGQRRPPRGASAGRLVGPNPCHAAHLLSPSPPVMPGRRARRLAGCPNSRWSSAQLPAGRATTASVHASPRSGQHRADHHGGQQVHGRSPSPAKEVVPRSRWVLSATPVTGSHERARRNSR